MVRFRVQKGSTFAFKCSSDEAQQVQSDDLRRLFTRAEDLETLQCVLSVHDDLIQDVSIAKRLDLGDVDRMITLCRQHPPQCVVGPASSEYTVAFQEFSAYLKQRQRAGVATLAGGYMLLLTPIPNWDNYLRCLVIKSKSIEMDAESVSSHSSMRSEGEETTRSQVAERSESEGTSRSSKRRKTRHSHSNRPAGTAITPAAQQTEDLPTDGAELSPRSRDARYAQLREEYSAFNSHHLQALQEWVSR